MNGYGTSPSTATKDKHFKEILNTHMTISKSIMSRYDWAIKKYYYFDLNAGPGIDHKGRKGSPKIFLDAAIDKRLPFEAYFFEIEKPTATILRHHAQGLGKVMEGNHHDTFPPLFNEIVSPYTFGLVYSDETGKVPPFNLLSECFSCPGFARIDVLIYIASANVKRALKRNNTRHFMRLSALIKLIDKKQWIIREPQDKHQWTFLIGSNWPSFPAFEKLGFYRIESARGKEIMHRLDYTNEEIKNGA